jgi:hypothetical protein
MNQGAQNILMKQKFDEIFRQNQQRKLEDAALTELEATNPEAARLARAFPNARNELVASLVKPQKSFSILTDDQAKAYGLKIDRGQKYQVTSNGFQEIAGQEVKEGAATQLDKLIAARDKLIASDPTSPNIKLYDAAIKKETEFAPPMQMVSMPQPVEVINPKTGRPELVQFPNRPNMPPQFTGLQKPEDAVRLKEVPPTQRTAFVANNVGIKQIDSALEELEKAPDEWFGVKAGLGNQVMQRLYPESTGVRSAIGGVSSIKRHDISGAAVTATEDKKLSEYIPSQTDTKEAIKNKLINFKGELLRSNDAIKGSFGEEYVKLPEVTATPPKAPAAPAAAAPKIGEVRGGYEFLGGNPNDKTRWRKK